MFNNYHQHNKARTGKGAAKQFYARTNLFCIKTEKNQAGIGSWARCAPVLNSCMEPPRFSHVTRQPAELVTAEVTGL